MAGPGLIYKNDYMYAREDELLLKWQVTAAKTVSPLPISNNSVLTTFDALASQAVIDNWLGSTNEFLLAQFDSTSMGTDAFGGLINIFLNIVKDTLLVSLQIFLVYFVFGLRIADPLPRDLGFVRENLS